MLTPASCQKTPFVSIIIPTYRDWDRLALCLEAMHNQTYSKSLFEILVINNNPEDIPASSLILPANARLLQEAQPGSYAARNHGIKVARGDLIGFIDSDCVPDTNWILNAVNTMLRERIDRVAGLVHIFRADKSSWLAWKFESITAFNQKYNVKNGVAVTANLFVKKSVFDKVGAFNEQLFSGGDIEWNKRATIAGYNLVLVNTVEVKHPARASMKELIKKSRRVIGGSFMRAKMEKKLLYLTLLQFAPPLRYIKVLLNDEKPFVDVFFAGFIFWGLKLLMVVEIIRLSLGGEPLR